VSTRVSQEQFIEHHNSDQSHRRLLSDEHQTSSSFQSVPSVHQHQIGEIVEVYDPTLDHDFAIYAFPAQIENIQYSEQDPESITSYDVLPGFGLETLSLSPSAIRPLKHFEYDTPAMCDFGTIQSTNDGMEGLKYTSYVIPCTVLSFAAETKNNGNGGWYSVKYRDETTEETKFTRRPLSKILRIIDDIQTQNNDVEAKPKPNYQVGSIVEIYDATHNAPFAFPATVTAAKYHPEHKSYSYALVHGITKTNMNNVEENLLHTYEVQDVGTRSLCNVGSASGEGDILMIPCTIVSHSDEEHNYEVVLNAAANPSLRSSRRDEEEILSLSYLSVQRFLQ